MMFDIGEKVVVPAHGIGIIQDIQSQEIMGMKMNYYIIYFEHDNISVNIPVSQALDKGVRRIFNKDKLSEMMRILQTPPVLMNKTSWNKKSKYLINKMNSGDIDQIAEVVRDIGKNIYKKLSYKEKIILEEAIARLSSEMSAMINISIEEARERIKKNLYTGEVNPELMTI